jgi:hypothetical protein
MKIDKQGLEEIRSTIETPFKALAEQLSDKGCLDKQSAEIVTFIFSKIETLGDSSWEVID